MALQYAGKGRKGGGEGMPVKTQAFKLLQGVMMTLTKENVPRLKTKLIGSRSCAKWRSFG